MLSNEPLLKPWSHRNCAAIKSQNLHISKTNRMTSLKGKWMNWRIKLNSLKTIQWKTENLQKASYIISHPISKCQAPLFLMFFLYLFLGLLPFIRYDSEGFREKRWGMGTGNDRGLDSNPGPPWAFKPLHGRGCCLRHSSPARLHSWWGRNFFTHFLDMFECLLWGVGSGCYCNGKGGWWAQSMSRDMRWWRS